MLSFCRISGPISICIIFSNFIFIIALWKYIYLFWGSIIGEYADFELLCVQIDENVLNIYQLVIYGSARHNRKVID